MHEVRTAIEIAAPAERVWSVLLDFARHREWNPFVRSIEGRAEVGQKLTVSIQPPGGRGMTFRPTLLEVQPNRRLRWLGHFLFRGIFDGEHYFEIETLGANQVRFIHGERFSGLLVSVFRSSLEAGTRAGFEEMNRALKARAEATATDAAVRGA